MPRIETHAPTSLAGLDLRPRGPVHPSPTDWRDQTFYFLLPDRFSDGGEAARPLYDPRQAERFRAPTDSWMAAGKRFVGGTLNGIRSKLGYLADLGVTALWIGPVWKQRADLQTYHGYGIQNFLDVDPRFGSRRDLRALVDAAHARGMFVILDIIYNHSGNNWYYREGGHLHDSLPYRYQPPYALGAWRSAVGQPTGTIHGLEDGVWPQELQREDFYTRAGAIQHWDPAGWEDPLHPSVEFRRGDFFDLKDFDHSRDDVLVALSKVYQYWIAVSDCDGYRIDTVKHIDPSASRKFCAAMREYGEVIGKENFFLLGEVTGGEYLARSYLDIFGRNLDAILDIGEARQNLIGMTKGLIPPAAFFEQYQSHDILGTHRETGRYHVSIIDDHDMVGSGKRRFAAGASIPAKDQQTAHAVGTMLTTLGIPCLYYGIEQVFDGTQDRHDHRIEPGLSFEDRYIREAMFGGAFGAFQTQGCHFFNTDHPAYLRIAAIARVRNRADSIGLALRRGRQYLREISDGQSGFRAAGAGEIIAWSRILFETEVVVVLNSHGLEPRRALVNVDFGLHPPGEDLHVLYDGGWSAAELKRPPRLRRVSVEHVQGRAAIRLELPPAGMLILA